VLSDGQVATSTRYGDEDVDFRVVLQDGNQLTLNSFHQIKITNRQGVSINLDEVVDFELHAGLYAIYHEDGEPTTTVTGDVDEDIITPLEVMAIVEDQFTFQHMRAYPGVRLDIGGEAADSRQAQIDIGVSFGLAAVGIYFLLMLLFESLTQPFIVLITIPFGIVGVILAFILHGITQASFFAGIGLVGLAGVVVNDALVMVAHLNHLKKQYKGREMTTVFDEVAIIAEGAANRLRPVILTTVTTVVGLLPLTYGIGGEDAMMAPMAMALGYGLLFATPITLILLPCLYLIRNDFEVLFSRIFSRKQHADIDFSVESHLMQDMPEGLVVEESLSYGATPQPQEEIE
jgi:multidrug efflux pump subunit AcrB